MPLPGAVPEPVHRSPGPSARSPRLSLPSAPAWLGLMLNSGGDERLWIDPATGRNRYGCPPGPAGDEIWLASSTASAVSARGWRAAGEALTALADKGPADLMDGVRDRLLQIYGVPGAACVLSASGTEAEFIALVLARRLAGEALTSLVVAPAETGSGVPAAADGCHFLSSTALGGAPLASQRLEGLERADILTRALEIRAPDGAARPAAAVDGEAEAAARQALAAGRGVLLHVLDCSKTGLSGVSRQAARAIVRLDPTRVVAVVDACQLRCDAAQVRADLADGLAVMITGSKSAGGPPFCGALLVPPAWAERLEAGVVLPAGLSDYSARLDWPEAWRADVGDGLACPANLGLGLRWSAALAEIEAFEALAPASRRAILDAFEGAVRARVAAAPGLGLLMEPGEGIASIVAIHCGRPAEIVRTAWSRLSEPGPAGALAAPCHLGQPVAVGDETVLRLCASMPMISAVAERLAQGRDLALAMTPMKADIDRALTRLELALNETA
jgi:hypothetical protein